MAFAHGSHELTQDEKKSHSAVEYVVPSRKKGKYCADCVHFIFGSPVRCQGVKSPIHWDGYCIRYKAR